MRDGDVALVRWPTERTRLDDLRAKRQPRLILVENGDPPPVAVDELEDWIRLPAGEIDIRTRVDSLLQRSAAVAPAGPTLDADGVLRFNGIWVALPPVEGRLMSALIDRFGAVVSRDGLLRVGWPGETPGRNTLDVHVLRMRRRVEPLGLMIQTVRSRGYLLERTLGFGA